MQRAPRLGDHEVVDQTAVAGDRLRVHFKNLDTRFDRPHSMHFHGVRYPQAALDELEAAGIAHRGWLRLEGKSVLILEPERLARRAR